MKRLLVTWVIVLLFTTACGLLGGEEAELPTAVSVAVLPTAVPTEIPPTATETPLATPTPEIAATATLAGAGPETAPDCNYSAAFVADVTIPDDTVIPPGVWFSKTWRIINNGDCSWPVGTMWVFDGGSQLDAPDAANLPATDVGQMIDVTVRFQTPYTPGTYTSYWRIRLPNGAGIGDRFFTRIIVPTETATRRPPPVAPTNTAAARATATAGSAATATAGSGATATAVTAATATATAQATAVSGWLGQYFNNRDLSGAPVVVRDDPAINFIWGTAAPANQLPADNFSVRWTRTLPFAQGTYRFTATMDDGMRIFIDGQQVLNEWRDGAERTVNFDYFLAGGNHTIVVEYYESVDKAVAQFSWGPLGSTALWRAQYWANKDLSGAPTIETQVAAIDIEWGLNGPPGLPVVDGFSARYIATIDFDPGTYRLSAQADDGVRVYVDDQLIINQWRDSSGDRAHLASIRLSGEHRVVVEHYDNIGNSFIKFSYTRTGD